MYVPKTTWMKTTHTKHSSSKGVPTIPFVSDRAFADTAQLPQRFLFSTAAVECVCVGEKAIVLRPSVDGISRFSLYFWEVTFALDITVSSVPSPRALSLRVSPPICFSFSFYFFSTAYFCACLCLAESLLSLLVFPLSIRSTAGDIL